MKRLLQRKNKKKHSSAEMIRQIHIEIQLHLLTYDNLEAIPKKHWLILHYLDNAVTWVKHLQGSREGTELCT